MGLQGHGTLTRQVETAIWDSEFGILIRIVREHQTNRRVNKSVLMSISDLLIKKALESDADETSP